LLRGQVKSVCPEKEHPLVTIPCDLVAFVATGVWVVNVNLCEVLAYGGEHLILGPGSPLGAHSLAPAISSLLKKCADGKADTDNGTDATDAIYRAWSTT